MSEDKYRSCNVGGLANLGNTCYLNSAIQCLSHCHNFLDFMLTRDFHDKQSIASELQELLKILWLEDSSVAPRKFVNYVAKTYGDILTIYEQNDIPEFLLFFIGFLNKSICNQIDPSIIEEHRRRFKKETNPLSKFKYEIYISWLETHKLEYSPFIDMLFGNQVSQVKCNTCKHLSHTYESFSVLSLAITDPEDCILQDMLKKYMTTEPIQLTCEMCKKQNNMAKSNRFWMLPKVLIIAFKRFDQNMNKMHSRVSLPESLSLDEWTLYDTQCVYKLKAIACHSGSMHSGHYCAVCRHPSGKWFIYDDDTIKEIPSYTKVHSSLYYTVFYEKSN